MSGGIIGHFYFFLHFAYFLNFLWVCIFKSAKKFFYESNSSGFYHLVFKKYPCLGFPLGPLNHGLNGWGSGQCMLQKPPNMIPEHSPGRECLSRLVPALTSNVELLPSNMNWRTTESFLTQFLWTSHGSKNNTDSKNIFLNGICKQLYTWIQDEPCILGIPVGFEKQMISQWMNWNHSSDQINIFTCSFNLRIIYNYYSHDKLNFNH